MASIHPLTAFSIKPPAFYFPAGLTPPISHPRPIVYNLPACSGFLLFFRKFPFLLSPYRSFYLRNIARCNARPKNRVDSRFVLDMLYFAPSAVCGVCPGQPHRLLFLLFLLQRRIFEDFQNLLANILPQGIISNSVRVEPSSGVNSSSPSEALLTDMGVNQLKG